MKQTIWLAVCGNGLAIGKSLNTPVGEGRIIHKGHRLVMSVWHVAALGEKISTPAVYGPIIGIASAQRPLALILVSAVPMILSATNSKQYMINAKAFLKVCVYVALFTTLPYNIA